MKQKEIFKKTYKTNRISRKLFRVGNTITFIVNFLKYIQTSEDPVGILLQLGRF